jgi:hypothetical protein
MDLRHKNHSGQKKKRKENEGTGETQGKERRERQ